MRNYRFLRLAGLYYIGEELYRDRPQLGDMRYAQQQEELFAQAHVYSNGMTHALARLGNEVHEVVYDLKPMQETWAKEQGISYRPESWQTDILLAQIERLRPEVLYLQDTSVMPEAMRERIKERFPFIRLVLLFTGSSGVKKIRHIDFLFVGVPAMVDGYRSQGLKTQLLYHGFDARIHSKLAAAGLTGNSYAAAFSFLGSSGFGHYYPQSTRYWDLLRLLKETDIRIWADEQDRTRSRIRGFLEEIKYEGDIEKLAMWMTGLNRCPTDINHLRKMLPGIPDQIQKAVVQNRGGQGFPLLNLRCQYPDRVHPPRFGLTMYDLIRRSKICLNIHMDRSCGSACNMRLFEATGMGTCLMTDTASNMRDLFEPDREVVTFESMEECIEKRNYLRDHEEARRQIALAGQKRTLRDHTMDRRARQVDATIQSLLNRGNSGQTDPVSGRLPVMLQPMA